MTHSEQVDNYWEDWWKRETRNYKTITLKNGEERKKYVKKGYLHFDKRFWFPDRKDLVKAVLKNGMKTFHSRHKRYEIWAFQPFVKALIKSKRFKRDDLTGVYSLENKFRPICYASHLDSLFFGFYSHLLTSLYESKISKEGFSANVIAYRSNLDGKCNIQFAKEVFDEIRSRKECVAIGLDLKGYFNNINHDILREKWKNLLNVKALPDDHGILFKAITKYSYVNINKVWKRLDIDLKKLKKKPASILELLPGDSDSRKFNFLRDNQFVVSNDDLHPETKMPIGIPQGSALSCLLSNLFLIDFDREISRICDEKGYYYRRYCDDILLICSKEDYKELLDTVDDKLTKDYQLTIQSKKTEIVNFRANRNGKIRGFNQSKIEGLSQKELAEIDENKIYQSFQYLGFQFDGRNVIVRPSSLSKYFRKMKSRISKTVKMAYSDSGRSSKIFQQRLLSMYSHLGKRNFLVYVYNASKLEYRNARGESKQGLNSPAIKRQLSAHMRILENYLREKNSERFVSKWRKGKAKKIKSL